MDYGMIGKIEKAKRYAEERDRITFNSLTAHFQGDNNAYTITLGADGWDCTCPGFRTHSICPHIMSLERLFKPMLKRTPLPYAPGQNVVSDVEKRGPFQHWLEKPFQRHDVRTNAVGAETGAGAVPAIRAQRDRIGVVIALKMGSE